MSIYKDGKLIAGGRQCMPLLSFVWADHVLNDASWLRADTFSWQSGAVYQAVYTHLTADITGKTLQSETISGTTIQFYLADDGHKICPASEESNVASIFSATGVAWYYIIDTTNQRFKLPRTKFGFTGIRTGVGKYVEAGIPNITGAFWIDSYYAASPDGAFTATDNYSAPNHGNWAAEGWRIHLDASRASSVYGNSDTVQPKATEMYLYFYVGNFTQTALENTAGLNAELFNGKVDVGHQVIAFQAPTAANNYTWYRKYADGWVEQGGQTPKDTGGSSVTLPVAMADANYSISCTLKNATTSTSTGGYDRYPGASVITTTGFWVDQPSKADYYTCWKVKGMAA
jgi:hypothetical protein